MVNKGKDKEDLYNANEDENILDLLGKGHRIKKVESEELKTKKSAENVIKKRQGEDKGDSL